MTSAAHEGALFLDKKQPGWAEKIDVDRLYMASPTNCILGQLFYGNYMIGYGQLGIDSHPRKVGLGFIPSMKDSLLPGALTEAWKKEIADRLQAA